MQPLRQIEVAKKKKNQQPWTSSGLGIKLTLLHSSGELILDLGIKLALLVTLLVLARQNKPSNVVDVVTPTHGT
jgi:hypothetical protein